jgi:putative ABC transport system permease protein
MGRKGSIIKGILGVLVGALLYRFIVAIALRLNVPTEFFKLVSAVIVAVAIAAPRLKEYARLKQAMRGDD